MGLCIGCSNHEISEKREIKFEKIAFPNQPPTSIFDDNGEEIRGPEILLMHTKDMSFEDHLRVDLLQKEQLHHSKQYDQYFQTKENYGKKHQQ
mmetsp:Transcript_9225/g.9073  ORF Transcript_9225/g.9073 Transcript_9225/m.9073 type:complete len:93 (-) Transcript_9225:88-366(-)